MPAVLPPVLTVARRGQPLARVMAVIVLAVPLVIATVALIPAFVICPFLGTDRQRLLIRLLASLRQWTARSPGQATHTRAHKVRASQAGSSREESVFIASVWGTLGRPCLRRRSW